MEPATSDYAALFDLLVSHYRYIVVDTRNFLPGKKVLISPAWVEKVDWAEGKVRVNLSQEGIRHSPPYNPSAPIDREYESLLYDYYKRPKYWP